MLGGLLSAGVGLASSLIGNKKKNNPGSVGMQQLERVPQYGYNAYNPFVNRGDEAEQGLFPQYQQMAYQPQNWLHEAESGYEQSPGFQYRKNQLMQGAHNTAAAGGFAGTDHDVNSRSEMLNGLLGGDMQQYLQNLFGIQGKGQHGLEERVNRGYNASQGLADYLGNVQGARAGYSGYAAGHQNQTSNNVYNALGSLINTGLGNRGGSGGYNNGGFMGGQY